MATVLDTQLVDADDRFDAYRETVSKTFVPLRPCPSTHPGGFECRLDSHSLGMVQISTIKATPHAVVRTPAAARRSGEAFFKLGLQMSGTARLEQDERQATLGPGEFAIYDTTRPYRLEFLSDYHIVVVMFPRSLLRLPAGRLGSITARSVSGRTGLGALLSPLLAGLEPGFGAGTKAGAHLGDAVLDLIAACFSAGDGEAAAPVSRRHELIAGVRSHIEAHLSDPALDVASIAGALHISTSYLQKLFASESSSVAAYIRERRLDRCRRDLADPANCHRSAAAIASRWGLHDASHFSRLFRQTYGMTPGEYRAAARNR
ncbi:AraC-like ligand-binding domain-containing protein [Amycolatopsis thermoflava]|uniref:AraC-like ligand-binding domain-containing protein n=1 Tax=Amycolatopsis thermoflava TaxID=84480 RepID=UPI0036480BA2